MNKELKLKTLGKSFILFLYWSALSFSIASVIYYGISNNFCWSDWLSSWFFVCLFSAFIFYVTTEFINEE